MSEPATIDTNKEVAELVGNTSVALCILTFGTSAALLATAVLFGATLPIMILFGISESINSVSYVAAASVDQYKKTNFIA